MILEKAIMLKQTERLLVVKVGILMDCACEDPLVSSHHSLFLTKKGLVAIKDAINTKIKMALEGIVSYM